MNLTRRQFLTRAGALGAAVALGGGRSVARAATAATSGRGRLPNPGQSGIDHIVVLCMENRSFDHFLGWVPRADGRQGGLSYPDDMGLLHDTHHLQDYSGCGFNDPDHSYGGGRTQLDGGAMDGFRRGSNDDFALGYFESQDLPTTTALVRNFTISDSYFCSILGPTYPNRFYTHAATTDRITNASTQSTLPTIWDRLADAGVSANYYFSDLPFLLLWGTKYLPIARPIDDFFVQAASGTLPSYTYLDPFFLGEDQGGSNDDHPHADIRRGQSFVAKVVNALMASPTWSNTVLVITYDEWGGFFEHVVPPVLPDNPPLAVSGAQYDLTQAGFRVPVFVVSPFARPGRICSDAPYDHTSILKMVEWRWGLKPLQPRDAAAPNLAQMLDFSYHNQATSIPDVADPGPHMCVSDNQVGAMGTYDPMWVELRDSPLASAWGLT